MIRRPLGAALLGGCLVFAGWAPVGSDPPWHPSVAPVDPLVDLLLRPVPDPDVVEAGEAALTAAWEAKDPGAALDALRTAEGLLPLLSDWMPLWEAEFRARAGDGPGVLDALGRIPADSGIGERWGGSVLAALLETLVAPSPGEAPSAPLLDPIAAALEARALQDPDPARGARTLTRGASAISELRPGTARAWRLLAVARADGDPAGARAALDLIEGGASLPSAQVAAAAQALESAGRWKESIPLRIVQGSLPELLEARARGGDPAGAIRGADSARALGSVSPHVLDPIRVRALRAIGRNREAVAALEGLVRGDSLDARGIRLLREEAAAALKGGDPARAARFLLRLAASPGDWPGDAQETARETVLQLLERGTGTEARALAEAAARVERERPARQALLFWGGQAAGAAGEAKERRRLLASAQALDPVSAWAIRAARELGAPPLPRFGAGPEGSGPGSDALRARARIAAIRIRIHGRVPTQGSLAWELARADGILGRDPGGRHALAEELAAAGIPLQAARYARRVAQSGAPDPSASPAWDLRLLRVVFPFPFEGEIRRTAASEGLDPHFVAALIRQESLFLPESRSPAGARGLMQVMPATATAVARELGLPRPSTAELHSVETGLRLGSRYLAAQLRRFGSEADALAAYNAGPTRVARWNREGRPEDPELRIERIPIGETRGYVRNILQNWVIYSALYGCLADERPGTDPCPHPESPWIDRPAAVSTAGEGPAPGRD